MSAADAGVGPLAVGERPAVVEVLARAFRDNPLNRAAIASADSERRLRSNRLGTRALLESAEVHGEVLVARLAGRVGGALVGTPPDGYPLPPARLALRLRCLLGQGLGVSGRWSRVFHALHEMHPVEPHRYLGTLGVDPALQRRGLGAALLAAFVARADAEGVCVYLETDRPENVPFYERAGFGVARESRVLGVPIWSMQRPARPLRG